MLHVFTLLLHVFINNDAVDYVILIRCSTKSDTVLMELLAHDTASGQNATNHSPAPLEETTEFGGGSVKENPDDMNISLTARERLLKKLQGRRSSSMVSCICISITY